MILFVADLLQPFDRLAVQTFLNGNVSHRHRRRSAMPMFLAWLEPNHIAGTNLLDTRPLPEVTINV